jgi:acyl carrier protein
MSMTRDEVRDYILNKLAELAKDWDSSTEIRPESLMFTEIGFESLDAVILGVAIQEHFGRPMPFSELLAELGEQQRDLSINELIDFVYGNLNQPAAEAEVAEAAQDAKG